MLALEPDTHLPNFHLLDTRSIPSQRCVNPLVPPGTTHVQVHPNALLPTLVMSNAWVFQGEIDVVRLESALGALTAWWPVLGGRYVRRKAPEPGWTDFAVELTQSPIALEIAEYHTPHPAFPSPNVIQDTLAPYLPTLGVGYHTPDSGTPLFAARLTTLRPANISVLGICLSHVSVDADGTCRLIHNLSQLYENPSSPLSPVDMPGFLARPMWPTWPPGDEVLQRCTLFDLGEITAQEAQERYAQHEAQRGDVFTRLDKDELGEIARRYGVPGGTGHDALCGWLIGVLERLGETRDTEIVLTFNYRRCFDDPEILPPALINQVDSVAVIVPIPKPPLPSSPQSPPKSPIIRAQQIASMLRNGIQRYRTDKQFAIGHITAGARQLESVNARAGSFYLFPPENTVNINSNMRYDWQPKFGFPGISSHHTTFSGRRYIRIFRSNPPLGVLQTKWEGGVDVRFAVRKGDEAEFGRLIEADRASWAVGVS